MHLAASTPIGCLQLDIVARWMGILSSLAWYKVPGKSELANHTYTRDQAFGEDSAFVLGGSSGSGKKARACMAGKRPSIQKKVFVFLNFGGDDNIRYGFLDTMETCWMNDRSGVRHGNATIAATTYMRQMRTSV